MNKTLTTFAALTVVTALSACSTPDDEVSDDSVAPSTSMTAPFSGAPSPAAETSGEDTAITITAGDQRFEATLNDSQVSRDFLSALPTTLAWDRNAGIEYITELDAPMTETGPFYTSVEAGDIVYYNPMDSITIIYAPTSSVPTLTKMGEVTSDLAAFENLADRVEMRIARR